jgi:cysteine desulfurase
VTRPPPIYLDYAATAPLDPRVAEAMQRAMAAGYANPASQHQAGRAARKVLEEAREQLAQLLGAKTEGMNPDRLVFTSGGTEANNLALLGTMKTIDVKVLIASTEHPSVIAAGHKLMAFANDVQWVNVSTSGEIELDHLERLLIDGRTANLVSVMLANNETGVSQPIDQISSLCRQLGVPLHSDGVQWCGKRPMHFQSMGIDALSIAPHKFHGPVGTGALLIRNGIEFWPQIHGGFQQGGLRPGTESVVLAAGFRTALELANASQSEFDLSIAKLRARFEKLLHDQLDNLVINGESAERLPHISNVAFLGCDRQQLFLALDFEGVYCSTGSACASGSSEPSPVLRAMGLPEEVVSSSLRFSFGSPTTREEIDESVERIVRCVKRLRSQKSARK